MPININQLPALGALAPTSLAKPVGQDKVERSVDAKRAGSDSAHEQAATVEVSSFARSEGGPVVPAPNVPGNEATGEQARRNEELSEDVSSRIVQQFAVAVRAQAAGIAPSAHKLI